MKKIFIIVTTIFVIGAGTFVYIFKLKPKTNVGYQEALSSGQLTYCTIENPGHNLQADLYTNGQQSKTITRNLGPSPMTFYHLNDGVYTYSWSDGDLQPTRFLNPPVQVGAIPKESFVGSLNQLASRGGTVNCNGISSDDSIFTPPSSINFQDISTTPNIPPTSN